MPRLSPEALAYLEQRTAAGRDYTLALLKTVLPEPPKPPDLAPLFAMLAEIAKAVIVQKAAEAEVDAPPAGPAGPGATGPDEAPPSEDPVSFVVLVGGTPVMSVPAEYPARVRTESIRRALEEHPEWRGLLVETAPVFVAGRVGAPRIEMPVSASPLSGYVVSEGRVRRFVWLADPSEVWALFDEYGPGAEIIEEQSLCRASSGPPTRLTLSDAAARLTAPPWWPEAPAEPGGAGAADAPVG